MLTKIHVTATRRNAVIGTVFALLSSLLLAGCNGGDEPIVPPVLLSGAPATNGVFDAALTQDGGGLWMSYSVVNVSPNDPQLPRVDTRIASSSNAGSNWADTGAAPYTPPAEFQVPYLGGMRWAAWQYEVSRLVYDPHPTDANLRWKRFWHRYLRAKLSGDCANDCLFENGWIGAATAPAPNGPWSAERKLLAGTLYNTGNDATIGAPEYTPATLAPGGELSDCPVFTEPGALATANGIYITLKCAGGSTDKVALIRCNHDLTGCAYRHNVLFNSEAAPFSSVSQSYDGFSATDLVTVGTTSYLIATPTLADAYRGCFVFQIADLDALPPASVLVRNTGSPVLIKSVAGTPGSFNGACGYTPAATASGIIYGQIQVQGSALQFGLYASGVTLP